MISANPQIKKAKDIIEATNPVNEAHNKLLFLKQQNNGEQPIFVLKIKN